MAKTKITDAELRDEIEHGLSISQIAEKYGLSRQAIDLRVKKLDLTTTAVAVVAPLESRRFVETKLNAIEELVKSLGRINKLYDACEAWLQDPDNPNKYDINPRCEEIIVQYWEKDEDSDGEATVKRAKSTLAKLLRRIDDTGILTIEAEVRIADPRQLILSTAAEARQIISQTTTLMMKLADARAMQLFMTTLLEAVKNADPETGQRIAHAVDDYLLLRSAEGEASGLSA